MSANTPTQTPIVKDNEVKDFTFAGCKVMLNWRGTKVKDGAFWTIQTPDLGPFWEPIEVHVKQVRKMILALEELDRRLSGQPPSSEPK